MVTKVGYTTEHMRNDDQSDQKTKYDVTNSTFYNSNSNNLTSSAAVYNLTAVVATVITAVAP